MKKVFLFFASAMICAAMASCGGNTEATDSAAADTTPVIEETEEIQAPAEPVAPTEDNSARQQAIMDAAQQICNCGDIMNCVNTVIDQSFAQYAQDDEFKAAVKEEAKKCIAEKAKQKAMDEGKKAAKEGANKAINEGIKALGKK